MGVLAMLILIVAIVIAIASISNIINAEGERAAAETLAEAARIISSTPGAIIIKK